MNIVPAKVRCSVSGHRWVKQWRTTRLKHALPMVACERCGEVGWLA